MSGRRLRARYPLVSPTCILAACDTHSSADRDRESRLPISLFWRRGPYQTFAETGESEIVVERSRFIGHALPVHSEDEAVEYVERLRKQHHDARHVCYGLRVGHGARTIDRSNDDGEPARTGGFPLWQLLEGEGVTDALIVVIRYYGGVKLGTGGLARAYREAGRGAMEDAGIVTRYPETHWTVVVPYDALGKVEHLAEQHPAARIVDAEYTADVELTLAVRRIEEHDVRNRLGALLQRDPDDFG